MKDTRNEIALFIPCFRILLLQIILQNTAIIASFTNSKRNFKLINDYMEKDMQKLKFVIMNKIHHCAIELNSAIVEICTTGWQICIRTVGVASKPIEPCPPYFAGFLTYGKRKFVENLKLIGSLLWKIGIINFPILYCHVYTVLFGIHEKKGQRL